MLAEYAAKLASVESAMKPFINGHPILALQNADDIALFDTDTGLGTKHWEGYGICNGDSYYSESAKKMIATPNLIDKMIVGAGSDYDVDDTGGAKTVTLDISEVPAHAHTLTDPGHSHTVSDSGHSHGVTQSPHTHSLTDPGHTHDATVTQAPNFHQHSNIETTVNVASGEGNDVPDTWTNSTDGYSCSVENSTEQTGISVGNASITIAVNSANTGVSVQSNDAGITMANAGGGEAHENMPPYYAVLFVMKL